jgi:hypothetical protein
MSHRKSILGVLVVGALCFCSLSAASAFAGEGLTLHECVSEVGTPNSSYSSSTCETTETGGAWHWKTLPVNTPVKVVPTLTPTTGGSEIHAVMRGVIGGVSYRITCTGLTSTNSEAENVLTGTVMSVKGHGKTKFTGCSMPAPVESGCTVPSTLETNELNTTTSNMTTTYKPAAGLEEKFITFTISGCTGGFTVLNGSKTAKGSVASVVEGTMLNASQMFTETSGSSLTFGGQTAIFEAVIHLSTENGARLGLFTEGES